MRSLRSSRPRLTADCHEWFQTGHERDSGSLVGWLCGSKEGKRKCVPCVLCGESQSIFTGVRIIVSSCHVAESHDQDSENSFRFRKHELC